MDGGGIMHGRFIAKMAVAIAVVFFGVTAFGIVVANSAAERAWTVTQDVLTRPFRPLARKADFQFSEHQQLRKIFLSR
jgi:methionyl-tRNA formyltransferase